MRQTYNDTAARYEQTDEGLLEPETPTERTHKTQQKAIVDATSANAAANAWRKALPKGPYGVNVARTGRHAVCYGAGGRVEVLDLHRNVRTAEVRCGEVCRAATFLHDETMVAVAQRKYVYVYDQDGAEVHRMAKHLEPEHLSYLPFHFLLASAGHAGWSLPVWNQISGAPRHRRDVVSVAASARWRDFHTGSRTWRTSAYKRGTASSSSPT